MADEKSMTAARLARGVVRRGRRRARRALDATPLARLRIPTVSIVLPIYNVEEYLRECLDSILEQSFGDFELLVVDDGSPDGSRAIAEEYAAEDPRIRIVTRPNGGLGAARNTGIRQATGRYLTFVDSDDVLPQGALGAMVDSAEASGSDIVAGSVRRFDSTRTWRPQWVERVHGVRRTGITITEFPPLLRNLYTWDKLFRRDFWTENGLWFREGVAYEDQPIITQLFARARSIDVIPDTVYRYRARDDKSSISQQTASLKDLRDRIEAWRVSRETLLAETPRELYDGWLQTLFDAHFHWYLRSPGTVDDDYWRELRDAVRELSADAPPHVWEETAPDRRVLVELARQDRREDAQELVRQQGDRWDKFPAAVRDDGILLRLPFQGDPDLDDGLFLLRPEQLELAHAVERLHWVDDTTLSVAGWAYIRKLDLSGRETQVSLILRNETSGDEEVFDAEGSSEPVFSPPVEDEWSDYASGTFRVRVPMQEVVAKGATGDEWSAHLRVTTAGFTVTGPVTNLVRSGSAGVNPAAILENGDRLVVNWRFNETLRFQEVPLALEVTDVRLDGRVLSGVLQGPATADVTRVTVASGDLRGEARLPRRTRTSPRRPFRVEVPEAEELTTQDALRWQFSVLLRSGERQGPTLRARSQFDQVQQTTTGTVAVQQTRTGELAVAEWALAAYADSLEATSAGTVRVTGRVFGARVESVALRTRNKKTRAYGAETPVRDQAFQAEITLQHELYRFGTRPLPTGEHDLSCLLRTAGTAAPVEVPLRLTQELSGDLPVPVRTDRHEGRAVRGPDGVVRVSLVRPIGDARGRYQQNCLRRNPPGPGAGGLRPGVLMRSYFGESATDNGIAIQQELRRRGSPLEVYWAVQDHGIPVPDGGVPVIVNSREWYELLGSVKYYVDNMYQPEYHRKPDGQVLVQTFHGYPFKVMGHQHWEQMQFSRQRIESYDERARNWDYLLSPARYATPLLTREFAYDGEVLEIGYPRNDVLGSPDAGELRRVVRKSLGIADHQTAVLYAPTFRDYLSKDDNRAVMADFFDFELAQDSLGDDFVVLVRGHAFNARSRMRVGSRRRIVDVTDYPEVSDLYLAADAGVVDYSSLRFDFGVTGKPMVFHVPDLDRYKATRGWLFDFEPTAPGPLVETTREVVDQLLDLDGVRARHADQYQAFRADYLDLEDGHAASRFVDAVFVPRGDA